MNSLAIKLDVSEANQDTLNSLLVSVGIKPQRRRFHCTVGFLDKCFQTPKETQDFVDALKSKLQIKDSISFSIGELRFVFRHIIALLPDEETHHRLKEINEVIQQKILSISKGSYHLNSQTTGIGYHPHITLWRQRHKDHRYRRALDLIGSGNNFPLELINYSYTIL